MAGAAVVVVCAVIGCWAVLMGVDGLRDVFAIAERGRSVDGTVLAKDKVRSSPQGGTTEKIKVRFTTADGTSHQFWATGDQAVGDTVRVRYLPERPGTATVHSTANDGIAYGVVILVGLMMVITMLLLVFVWVRDNLGAHRRAARSSPVAE
ncbi:DUF3592 domain-containing protein [Streptomyces pini]|uniref:DUF3592 domain-containing protein n=1 Tax=Streptomyces pini TaxID=1520580 RepID=UPI000B8552F0|nr:DUF3592 domain-containing protein [Streptomyces pini]